AVIPAAPGCYSRGHFYGPSFSEKLAAYRSFDDPLPHGSSMPCSHAHAEDDWHGLGVNEIRSCTSLGHDDNSLFSEIGFLIENEFIVATFRSSHTRLAMRIYLVPYDLPGMGGRLKCRKKHVVSRARRGLSILLPKVQASDWQGTYWNKTLLTYSQDNRTLSEIYGDVPSPHISSHFPANRTVARLLDFNDSLDDLGLWTTLYLYQRQSIAAMLMRETSQQLLPDPLYIELTALNSRAFYFQPSTMEVLLEQPYVSTCSGGILCEELGTGKTRNQSRNPQRSVLTPISFASFPCYVDERARLLRGRAESGIPVVPSFKDILLHRLGTLPHVTLPNTMATNRSTYEHHQELLDRVQSTHLNSHLKENTPFYYHHPDDEPSDFERLQRRGKDPSRMTRMYLTVATLIVVPVNLLSQWEREIHKHCEYPLRVLVVRSKTKLPATRALASDYDIVLMTIPRFTAEHSVATNVRPSRKRKQCHCPTFLETGILDCSCAERGISPLTEIRWKRLVVDEGHVSACTNTILTPFVKTLSVEHRWIVTGTPTTNLLGLGFGASSTEELEQQSQTPSSDGVEHESCGKVREWTNYDREDLRKLGSMISNFIGGVGPLPGSIQVLTQVMSFIMIRHRVEDVEKDIVLPSITQESVFLDLDPLAIKSYNALQAGIVINAIDSERKDQNAVSLQDTVENMTQALFWAIDEGLYNSQEILRTSHEHVQRAKDRGASQEDQYLLEEAIVHMRAANTDHLWRSIHAHDGDVPYRVTNMSNTMFNAWSRTTFPDTKTKERFIHGDRLIALRDSIVRQPLIPEFRLVDIASALTERDEVQRKFLDEVTRKQDAKKRKQTQVTASAKKTASPEMIQDMKKELDAALKRLEHLETHEEEMPSSPASHGSLRTELASGTLVTVSPHRNIHVGSSPSSKLNYIINEVLKYASTEKFLIFSSSVLTLALVGEALELLGIKFLRFTTVVPVHVREQTVLTFETSENYRIFLMELKHGARGLNLVSASRVIFCEPVWQADVESQAIKRVHRIGQSKPVSVKTLAIRGTAEENMLHRRKLLRSDTQQKLPRLLDEAGMRHYIEHPQFIRDPPQILPQVDFQLFNISQRIQQEEEEEEEEISMAVDVPAPSPRKRVRVLDPVVQKSESPPKKKKSAVRFAD
ncbi:hypothetical protein BDZ89DRAFT_1078237, partial [Hymenopellis radicata]